MRAADGRHHTRKVINAERIRRKAQYVIAQVARRPGRQVHGAVLFCLLFFPHLSSCDNYRRISPGDHLYSLQGDERAIHAGAAVLDRVIGDGELGQGVPDAIRLDLNDDVLLPAVGTDAAAEHIRHDHHVP